MKNFITTLSFSFFTTFLVFSQEVTFLKDVVPGDNCYNQKYNDDCPHSLINVNGTLFFVLYKTSSLYKTDGTKEGTVLVKNFNNYKQTCDLIAFNGKLYFNCDDNGKHGVELWVSDGTEAGTKMVKNINTEIDYSYGDVRDHSSVIDINHEVINLDRCVYNNLLFFTAEDSIHGRELWRTDGTEQGTILIKDLLPGTNSSVPQYFLSLNNKLYFTTNSQSQNNKYDLWESDGTEQGTNMVSPNLLTHIYSFANNKLLIATDFGELDAYDCNTKNTSLIYELTAYQKKLKYSFNSSKSDTNICYFTYSSVDTAYLMQTNGTKEGTRMIYSFTKSDLSTPSYVSIGNLELLSKKLIFSMGDELWSMDRKTQVFDKVLGIQYYNLNYKELYSTATALGDQRPLVFRDKIYFRSDYPPFGNPLFKENRQLIESDGTVAGTKQITKPLTIKKQLNDLTSITSTNDAIYFLRNDSINGAEIWRYGNKVEIKTSVLTSNQLNKINIYPNPSNGKFNITGIENKNISIFNINGITVFNVTKCTFDKLEIDLKNKIESGMYIIKISDDLNEKFVKVIIE